MAYRFELANTDSLIAAGTESVTTDTVTLVAWCKVLDTTNGHCIISVANDSVTNEYVAMYLRGDITNDPARARLHATGANVGESDVNNYTANAWHLLIGEFGADAQTITLDGVAGTTATENDWPSGIDSIAIGCLHRTTDALYTDGYIARAAVLDGFLTAAQKKQLLIGEKLHDIPGIPTVNLYVELDDTLPGTNDVGTEPTNDGVAFAEGEAPPTLDVAVVTASTPFTADDTDVAAFDSTQLSYFRTVTLPEGRVSLLGVFATSDDGDVATFSIEAAAGGRTNTNRTLNDDNLSSLSPMTYFGDGASFTVSSAGDYVVGVTSSTGSPAIEGFQVVANGWQQGGATHCAPRAVIFDDGGGDAVWSIALEDVTGDIWVLKDGVPQEEVFAGVSSQYNDTYHNGAAIQVVDDFLVVAQVLHSGAEMNLKRSDSSGDFSGATARDIGNSGIWTYVQLLAKENDELLITTRGATDGSGRFLCVMETTGIADLNTGAPTVTYDVVADDLTWTYPRQTRKYVNGSDEVYLFVGSDRDEPDDQGPVVAMLYDPNAGSNGEWYNLNGVDATNQSTRGTEASPRFDATAVTTLTSSGGVLVLAANGSGQQFVPFSIAGKITSWPTSGNPKGAVGFIAARNDATETTTYATTDLLWVSQNEGTRTVSSAGALLTATGMNTPNSPRIPNVIIPAGDVAGADNLVVVCTNRGTRTPTDYLGESTPLYHDWGSADIVRFEITDAFSASPSFSTATSAATGTGPTVQAMDYVGGGRVFLRDALAEFHPTHRFLKYTEISVSTSITEEGETGRTQLHNLMMLGAI